MLERLGRFAARKHWLVIIVWVVIGVVLLGLAKQYGGKTNDNFSIPGTQSDAAQNLLAQNAPGFGNASVNAVFQVASGSVNDAAQQAQIQSAITNLKAVPGVSNVSDPFQQLPQGINEDTVLPIVNQPLSRVIPPSVSSDGTTALVSVQMNAAATDLPTDTFTKLQAAVQPGNTSGMTANLGGALVDIQNPPPPGISEYADEIGLLFAVIILLVALGSVTAMVVPIGVALFGLGISTALLALAEGKWEIGSAAPALGVMIGLGVGIDYSLFIVNRYRQNLGMGMDVEKAVGRAVSTSGSAVLFAAITVCLALIGLAIIRIPYVTTLGFAAAMFVFVTVCAALTVLPALLGLLGRKIDALKLPWHKSAEEETPEELAKTFSARWGREIAKHPLIFTIVSIGALLLISYPMLQMKLGIPDDSVLPSELTQTKAFNQISAKFGPGRNGPLLLVADLGPQWGSSNAQCNANAAKPATSPAPTTTTTAAAGTPTTTAAAGTPTTTLAATPTTTAAAGAPTTTAAGTPTTAAAGTPTTTAPPPPPQVKAEQDTIVQKLGPALYGTSGVQSITPVFACTGNAGVAVVIPTTGPSDPQTTALVENLRDNVIPNALTGTSINPSSMYVGGQTAILIDLSDVIGQRMPAYIGAVLLLSFLLLMMVFRSIFVPIKAVIMNLLSIGAALGFLVAVFQWGWINWVFGVEETLAIVAFIPVMMFAVLFGLSMDYEVFLLSRIHEEWLKTHDHREAVVNGLGATARVITAAALIMISVFLTFSFNPSVVVKMLALGMAAAVLIDSTIVRMIAVPSTMELAGKWAWWIPKWLDKILPHINVDAPEPEEIQPSEASESKPTADDGTSEPA